MKVFISADMEGVAGANVWDEVDRTHRDYPYFVEQMTAEVNAACEAAFRAGAKEITVKDAHSSGRNLIHSKLPAGVRLVRGWSGHPYLMAQELDSSFDAMMMLGYHAPAGHSTNTLAHTMTGRLAEIWLNGKRCSEFLLHGTLGATLGVPTIFVSGDDGLAKHIQEHNENVVSVVTGSGIGDSTFAEHPKTVIDEISAGVEKALNGDLKSCLLPTADSYKIELEFKTYHDAYKGSFFPGVERVSDRRVQFTSSDYFEIMRAILFLTWKH